MKKKNGFTLIEMIAVISIMAVLLAFSGIAVFGVIDTSQDELLEDQIAALSDTAITYVTSIKKKLSTCSNTFDPASPTTNASDASCYIAVKVSTIINNGYFKNHNSLCNPDKDVIVYRKNYGGYTEIKGYVPDNTCSYN